MISLDGLLDYNETDKLEPTFEVSLFAELFQEMLQRDFGWMIFNAIKNFNGSPDKKRKRGSEDPKEIPQSKKMRVCFLKKKIWKIQNLNFLGRKKERRL